MNITSLSFLFFIGIAAIIYYLVPLKARWIVLLASNLYFLYNSNGWIMNVIWLGCALVTYGAAVIIKKYRESKVVVSKKACIFSCGSVYKHCF